YDPLRFAAELRLHLLGVDVECPRIDVAEDRPGADARDRTGRGEEGERRADHFVAALDPQRHQRAKQGVSPATHADRMLRLAVVCQMLLKPLDRGPEDQGLLVADLIDGPA